MTRLGDTLRPCGPVVDGRPAERLGQFVPAVQKVTAEQVREIGKKYFAPESQSWVVVGDPAAIGEQLKAFGEFTTVK